MMLVGLPAVGTQLQQGLALPPAWVEALLPASLKVLPGAKLVNIASMLQAAGQLALPLPPVWLAAAMVRLQQLLVREGLLLPPEGTTHHAPSSSSGGGGGSEQDLSPPASALGPADSSSGSRVWRPHVSMVLSARIQRQWLQVRLQQVLTGLRAQQMLNPAAQRKLWLPARQLAEEACWGTAAAAAGVAGADAAVGVAWARATAGTPGAAAEAASGPAATKAVAELVLAEAPANSRHGIDSSDVLAVWPWLGTAVSGVWADRRAAQQALQTLAVRD
jgi:hypothetical protein